MREGIVLTAKLGVMMLIAGLCLGLTSYFTEEPIRIQRELAGERLRMEVLSDAAGTALVDVPGAPGTLKQAYRAENGAGYVFEMNAGGFGGTMSVTVGIRSDGTIEGVRVSDHAETPGLGAKAADEAFYGQYLNKPAQALTVVKRGPLGDGEIQSITAATITSRAVTNAVNDAVACYRTLTQ